MKSKVRAALVAALLLGTPVLTACIPDHGTVIEKAPIDQVKTRYRICVRSSDKNHKEGCDSFKPSEVRHCEVGDRWPDCKED